VAPVIEYANRNFYDHAVLPLRVPRAGERIEPPLVDLFVEDGVRDGRDRNDAEAQAIADEIGAILADERFMGRTLGVVSLLGLEQARHIDAVVRARFDAAELLRRHFTCGDARTFQGSERDIMFLSLVVDARQCKALSGNGAEQRFNVAASRARDRMVLVRSVRLEDLSEKDLRRTLLAHFENPLPGAEAREDQPLRALCESGFEREVFDALVQRGYRVLPQVRAGAYRIDLVVEGAHDARLAIECDGDAFHGPERWQQDVQRQRVLERAGWVFWRCFASTWTLHRDEVLAELLSRLAELGIAPLGGDTEAPSRLVAQRVWRAPPPSAEAQQRLREAVEEGQAQEEA
jgi:very-short-patch-repair endonuclease